MIGWIIGGNMRLIDADAIDYDEYWYNKGFSIRDCQKAQQLINEQPTVITQTAIYATLLEPDEYYSKNIWRKCSNCNRHIEKYYKYVSFVGKTSFFENELNYCPKCGAKFIVR